MKKKSSRKLNLVLAILQLAVGVIAIAAAIILTVRGVDVVLQLAVVIVAVLMVFLGYMSLNDYRQEK